MNAILELYADQGDDNADKWDLASIASTNYLQFRNNTTPLMTITSGGNVGIGTEAPSSTVQIRTNTSAPHLSLESTLTGAAGFIISVGNQAGGNARMYLQSNVGAIVMGNNGIAHTLSILQSNNSVVGAQFAAEGESFMLGNVGIGTNNPAAKLDVNGGDFTIGGGVIYPSETGSHARQTSRFIVADSLNDAILTNASGWGSGGTDFAEVFDTDGTLTTGDIVEVTGASDIYQNMPKVTKTISYQSNKMLGVVTDRAGFIGGRRAGDGNLSGKIVGLLGRIPLKVSTKEGPIALGDPLTSSVIPGVAVKATKAGPIIARALEPFDPQRGIGAMVPCDYDPYSFCGTILSFVQYNWYDPSASLAKNGELLIAPKTAKIGEETAAASSYDLKTISGKTVDNVSAFSRSTIAELTSGIIKSKKIAVEGAINAGKIISDTAQFASAQVTNLLAKTINVSEKIVSPVVETKKIETGIISPLADNQEIKVDLSRQGSRLTIQGENGEEKASIDSFGNIKTEGAIQSADIEADNITAASVSAETVKTEDLEVDNLKVKGEIKSKQLDNLQSSFGTLLSEFDNLKNNMATLSATPSVVSATPTPTPAIPTITPTIEITPPLEEPTPTATNPPAEISSPATASAQIATTSATAVNFSTPSADLESTPSASPSSLLEKLKDFLDSSDSLNNQIEEFIATSSALIDKTHIINAENSAKISGPISFAEELKLSTLSVIGASSLSDTAISGQLLIDGQLLLENNKIASLGKTLYFSSLNFVDFMGSKLIVDSSGNLTTEGTILAKGGLTTSTINSYNGDLTINLGYSETSSDSADDSSASSDKRLGGFGRLLVRGNNEQNVASIDSAGNLHAEGNISAQNASFSGEIAARALTTEKIRLSNLFADSTPSATFLTAADNFLQNGINAPAIKTEGAAGSATLPSGYQEIVIFNPNVADNTLIYITPTSSTENRTLFVAEKKTGSYFKVSLDTAIARDVKFNWWMIN
jgi:hypothetical protein